jgi:hypothetical protein
VAADPLRESAQRLLVRVHLNEGNVAEAFRQYGAYADLLHRELGAAPSRVMTDLLEPYRCGGAIELSARWRTCGTGPTFGRANEPLPTACQSLPAPFQLIPGVH